MTPKRSAEEWTGNKIRSMFLGFFEERGHKIVRSSSLVPANDPTLLFTNAGMNQFKDVFLGLETRDYKPPPPARNACAPAASITISKTSASPTAIKLFSKCSGIFRSAIISRNKPSPTPWNYSPRTSGTACRSKNCISPFSAAPKFLPASRWALTAEAAAAWEKIGAAKDRIVPIPGLKDNFWAMGDTGPCGPCSEIFYDMGIEASEHGHKDCKFPCECGRYVEIWNLVFMQFNRDASAVLNPLPKPSVDTGMGLERITAVLENVISNYETDLFIPLLKRAAELCGVDFREEEKYEAGNRGASILEGDRGSLQGDYFLD